MRTKDVVADNLKTLRELRGLSQPALARRAGVSRRTIARLEAGEIADPGVGQICALGKELGVTVEMLVGHRLGVVRLPVPEQVLEALRSAEGAQVLARMVRAAREG